MGGNAPSSASGILAGFLEPWRQFLRGSRADGVLFTMVTVLYRHIPNDLFHAKGFVIVTEELTRHCLVANMSPPEVRRATPKDLDLLSKCGLPRSVLRGWFTQGAQAWLTECQGELLACYWLDSNERYHLYDWLVLKSPQTEVWILWWWVHPQHRRQDLAYQVQKPGVSQCAHAGLKRMLGVVDRLNRNAIRATQRIGWSPLGRVFVLRILGFSLVKFNRSTHVGRWSWDDPLELSLEGFALKAAQPEKG